MKIEIANFAKTGLSDFEKQLDSNFNITYLYSAILTYTNFIKRQMTQKIFYFFLAFFLISCMHTEEFSNSLPIAASREKVWKVLVEIFKTYPIKTIDEQLGYIETEVIKSANVWKAPHQKQKDFSGYSYVLKVSLNYNKPISTVTVNKKVYKQKGFISQKQEVPSDHLEEVVLLYQIARELEVQSLLKRLIR